MIVTITHLTRMRPPYICAAGLQGRIAVRPVIAGQLHKKLLRSNGGLFEIGAVVDLGPVQHVGTAPEHEDHRFNPTRAKYLGRAAAETFWRDMKAIAQPSVEPIFGEDLTKRGSWSCGVDQGRGRASLGCLQVYGGVDLFVRGLDPQLLRSGPRLALKDPILGKLDLGITDVRFFEEDFITVKDKVVESVRARIHAGVGLLLSVGLTRATVPADKPLHWLQVNNLHLEDAPLWNHT